ncbi:unnamed protein product [Symbiodinium sp. CCMP2592]|nr:unnamed protein product [Symbiodinium sp. CCMP2592]
MAQQGASLEPGPSQLSAEAPPFVPFAPAPPVDCNIASALPWIAASGDADTHGASMATLPPGLILESTAQSLAHDFAFDFDCARPQPIAPATSEPAEPKPSQAHPPEHHSRAVPPGPTLTSDPLACRTDDWALPCAEPLPSQPESRSSVLGSKLPAHRTFDLEPPAYSLSAWHAPFVSAQPYWTQQSSPALACDPLAAHFPWPADRYPYYFDTGPPGWEQLPEPPVVHCTSGLSGSSGGIGFDLAGVTDFAALAPAFTESATVIDAQPQGRVASRRPPHPAGHCIAWADETRACSPAIDHAQPNSPQLSPAFWQVPGTLGPPLNTHRSAVPPQTSRTTDTALPTPTAWPSLLAPAADAAVKPADDALSSLRDLMTPPCFETASTQAQLLAFVQAAAGSLHTLSTDTASTDARGHLASFSPTARPTATADGPTQTGPGPKSGGGNQHYFTTPAHEPTDARVGLRTESSEAPSGFTTDDAKAKSGPYAPLHHRKKALHKAQRQASQHGFALYRGQVLSSLHLQAPRPHEPSTALSSAQSAPRDLTGRAQAMSSQRRQHRTRRCRLVSWNSSGLTSLVWAELKAWMQAHLASVDVLCVQETYWRDDLHWQDSHWTYIHHGCAQGAGLLVCVSKRFAPEASLRHTPVIPGRLQHLRIFPAEGHQPLDLIHVYQFAWHHRKKDNTHDYWADCLHRRAEYLHKLGAVLKSIPRRNVHCLIGDFNTQLLTKAGIVGTGIPPTPGPQLDVQDLLHVLETYGLIALNTFGSAPGSTFINDSNSTQSQIDYILARAAHSDRLSRQAQPLTVWPVGTGRLGMKHIPVAGSITLAWCPWQLLSRPQPTVRPHQVVAALRADPSLQATFVDKLRAQLPAAATLKDIDRALQDTWLQLRPNSQAEPSAPVGAATAPTQTDTSTLVPRIWELRAERRLLAQDRSLHGQLAHWRVSVRIQELERVAGAARRRRKRQFLLEQMEQAEAAAQRGHLTAVYAAVRRLAPKKAGLKLHVRTPEGHMQGPRAERDTLIAHFRELYQASSAQPGRALPCTEHLFTEGACTAALMRLPAQKAAHPKSAPGVLWKLGASILGPALSHILNNSYANVPSSLPLELRQVAMCLVPKPGRRAQQPSDARPISLLHPANKAHASMLNDLLAPFLVPYLATAPQFAYCHGRSTMEALHRVFSHFHAVRAQAPTRSRMVQRRRDNTARHPCTGGLSFSLDVAQAFDSIPRWVVVAALRAAGTPEAIITQVVALHAQILLEVDHGGEVATCHTARGVRQGCPLSPSLWAAATTFVYHRLLEELGPGAAQVLTVFADDIIGQWQITSLTALQDSLDQIRRLTRVLQHHGFQVSPKKSVILLQVIGPHAERCLGKLRFRDQGVAKIRVAADLSYPVVRRHTYLGMIIGYGAFERHSVDYRCKRAAQVFARLRQVLCGRHGLSQHNRLRLWRAIVWPSLKYGLAALPLDPKNLQRVRGFAARHLRAITHNLGHETHKTNQELFDELGLHPVRLLRREAQNNFTRFQTLPDLLRLDRTRQWHALLLASLVEPSKQAAEDTGAPSDLNPPPKEASTRVGMRRHPREQPEAQHVTLVEIDAVARPFACPDCPCTFATAGILHTHRVKKHGADKRSSTRRTTQQQNQVEHSLGGVPTCRYCLTEFNGWRNFNSHILFNNCPKRPVDSANAVPTVSEQVEDAHLLGHSCRDGSSVVPAHPTLDVPTTRQAASDFHARLVAEPAIAALDPARQKDWKHIAGLKPLRARMEHYCPECNLWAADSSRVKVHFRAKHKDLRERLESTEVQAKSIAVLLNMTAAAMEQEEQQEWDLYSKFMGTQPGKDHNKKQLTQDEKQELTDLRQLCEQLIRLALRHEDGLKALQLDTSFVIWLRVGLPGGLPESLHQSAEAWRADRDLARTSLRRTVGWEANAETGGRLVPDAEKQPLNMQEVRENVDHIVRLSQDADLITRFCPTRPLAAELRGPSITFLCSVANRSTPSDQLHAALQTLCANASCQVLGMAVKPERLARSPLANALARQLPTAQLVSRPSLLKAKLLNRSNVCYSNCTMLCLLWLQCQCRQDLLPRALLSSLEALLKAAKPFSLWDLWQFKQLLRHWRDPGRQHDAAEFIKSYQAGADTNGLSGVWQARTTAGEVRFLGDTSPLPLSVPLTDGATVQQLVTAWSAQDQVHALWRPPECLVLQLSRYGSRGKLHTHISLDDGVVQFPCFVASTNHVCHVDYQLQAAAIHLGSTPHEGHYRAALFDEGNKLWYADDGKHATLANAKTKREIQSNCYVLYLTRV